MMEVFKEMGFLDRESVQKMADEEAN